MEFSAGDLKSFIDKKVTITLKGGGKEINGIVVSVNPGKGKMHLNERTGAAYHCEWQILITEIAAIGEEVLNEKEKEQG